ncbi:Isochorismatase-like protein [Vararia minispora EC-137]|uniref:Isochorismatase-like protein n=1 Tax=Vararia minispora EC-137 TaxID=1314806 RepID=A0ACB8QFD1_9AGAM|nr:Isochorismatase-like protein [Vararia minispora EC-137]
MLAVTTFVNASPQQITSPTGASTSLASAPTLSPTSTPAQKSCPALDAAGKPVFTYDRLDKNDAALLIVDHQDGLYLISRDMNAIQFKANILAHAELANIFNLPTVITTSTPFGPNAPLPIEITELHPNTSVIVRGGEVNAWDNADFRAAVQATGKKQIILGGITTDACTTFLALSLREAGYSVFANADASGTFDLRTAQDANDRMRSGGVQVLSLFAIACELMRDWRNTPGTPQMLPFFDKYLPQYGFVARAHDEAILNGTATGIRLGDLSP